MNEIVAYIEEQLRDIYPPQELRDIAWWVAEEATGMSRTELLCGCKGTKDISDLQIIVARLRKKEPIAYIFGRTLWCGLDLEVNRSTLIPRQETAELVDAIGQRMQAQHDSPLRVLDIGTGSGCIAIALKQQHPAWQVTGMDISADALQVARSNAQRNKADVMWLQGDILTEDIGYFDLIVSNPPYICEQEKRDMDSSVLDYEPATALFVPDDDPLLYYRRIATLRRAEHLYFELNARYAQAAAEMLNALAYTDVQLTTDIYGKQRILYGRLAPAR